MSKKIIEKKVDCIHRGMEHGRTIFDDGTVIPFCRLVELPELKTRMEWDRIGKKWMEIPAESILVENEVFDCFVDDEIAPHGYRATTKKAMKIV